MSTMLSFPSTTSPSPAVTPLGFASSPPSLPLSHASIVDDIADPNFPRVATLVHRWIGEDEVVAVNLLIVAVWSWALIIVFSRVVLGRNYLLNVFFGACFGVLEAIFTVRFLKFHVLDLIGDPLVHKCI